MHRNTNPAWPHCVPFLQMACSALLLLSAVFEMFDTVIEEVIGMEIRALHGLIVYAVAKVVKEGMEFRDRYTETRERIGEVRREIGEEGAHGTPVLVRESEPVSG